MSSVSVLKSRKKTKNRQKGGYVGPFGPTSTVVPNKNTVASVFIRYWWAHLDPRTPHGMQLIGGGTKQQFSIADSS